MTLTPAYGADYKSAKEAKKAWDDGKDFIINEVGPNNGRSCNKDDAPVGRHQLRYKKLQSVIMIEVKPK